MKHSIILLAGLLVLFVTSGAVMRSEVSVKADGEDELQVYASPELFTLVETWAAEYGAYNPAVSVAVHTIDKPVGANGVSSTGLQIVSSHFSAPVGNPWSMLLGRSILVPVYNPANPYADLLEKQGITIEGLRMILTQPDRQQWGTLLNIPGGKKLNLYLVNNLELRQTLTDLTGKNPRGITCTWLEDETALLDMVSQDPCALGMGMHAGLMNVAHTVPFTFQLLPMDRNENGYIDYKENIYSDLNTLERGAWIGKFPPALVSGIYSVSEKKPMGSEEMAFLKWILADGQEHLETRGYSGLLLTERNSRMDLLNVPEINVVSQNAEYAGLKILLVLAGAATLLYMMRMVLRRSRDTGLAGKSNFQKAYDRVFDENKVDIPLGLYYDKSHTWAFMESDGMVRVGIGDFLQHVTGPLTRIKLKDPGERIRKGKPFVSIIRNGKQLNLQAPVSGTIKVLNKKIQADASLLNTSPYADGWIYMIEPSNWLKEAQYLVSGWGYREKLRQEFSRLKDFLNTVLRPSSAEYASVLQDGGALKDGVLGDMGPQVWDDFQTQFIDQ